MESTPSQTPNQYWAATEDSQEFGQKLKAKLDVCREALHNSSHIQHVATAYTHYYGQDIEGVGADGSRVTRSGEQGEVADVRVPQVRALAHAAVNIITGAKVAWNALATNNDHASKAACVTASGALEYYWKDRGVFSKGVQAVKEGIPLGEGFLFTPWDPNLGADAVGMSTQVIRTGDVAFHNVSTWDVLRDPTYKSWDGLPWIAVVLWVNKYDVAAQYPEYATDALAQPAVNVRWTPCGELEVEPDCIPVTHWYHKRTPAVQNGREAIILDSGRVLHDAPLSRAYWEPDAGGGGLPVHRYAAGELLGSPFPFTSFWGALGIQQVSDSVHTSLSTNITSTAPGLVSAERDSEMAPDSIAGGPKILYRAPGSQPPTAVNLQPASPEQFRYLETLRKEQQQLLNLNATALGNPEGVSSGAAYALLSSMAIQNNSDLQGAWVDFVTRVGNCVLALWRENVSVPRKIAIAGKGRASLVRPIQFKGEDFQGVARVLVEIGNPMQQTAAGRMELAQLFLQIPGVVRTPEQIQSVVDTGRLDPLTQDLSNQLLLISQENEALAEGQEVPTMLTDDHRLHAREHAGVGASIEARSDPKVMAVLQAHIAEHIRILRETDPAILLALGQQPLPMPMAPGAMPAPGGDAQSVAPPPAPADAAASVSMPSMPTNPQTGEDFAPAAGAQPQ